MSSLALHKTTTSFLAHRGPHADFLVYMKQDNFQFVAITETDDALAQMILQDVQWDVQRALAVHFGEGSSNPSPIKRAKLANKEDPGPEFNTKAPEEIVYLCWNVDGLSEKNLEIRMKGVYKLIKQHRADIVCLQEMVADCWQYLKQKLPEYEFVCEDENAPYFVGILLRRFILYLDNFETVEFPGTRMHRNLLKVNCHVGKCQMSLLTSHLESTRDYADERMKQLKICFKELGKIAVERMVVFGGDLNLRDTELATIGGIPSGVDDIWERMGRRSEVKYTWDMSRNTNLEMSGKPRARFDRVYVRDAQPLSATVQHFGLIGIERIKASQCFPSDHWGIICIFKVNSN